MLRALIKLSRRYSISTSSLSLSLSSSLSPRRWHTLSFQLSNECLDPRIHLYPLVFSSCGVSLPLSFGLVFELVRPSPKLCPCPLQPPHFSPPRLPRRDAMPSSFAPRYWPLSAGKSRETRSQSTWSQQGDLEGSSERCRRRGVIVVRLATSSLTNLCIAAF